MKTPPLMRGRSLIQQKRLALPVPGQDCPASASVMGTAVLLFVLALTGLNLGGDTPSQIAGMAARFVAVGIVASILFDLRMGVRNLIRADTMALAALYFLTLFEYLFPQPEFDLQAERNATMDAVKLCLVGIAGLAVGRHLLVSHQSTFVTTFHKPVSPGFIFGMFWFCFFFGYLHQFVAVDFDITRVIYFYLEPRFSQPWQRGQLGDWKALLNELGLLLYLLPPLGGIVLAKRAIYPKWQIGLIGAGLLWTLFYGFSSGTRNIFACFLATFLIGYCFALQKGKNKELLVVVAITGALLMASVSVMLEFRQVGLRNYWEGNMKSEETVQESLFIDANLYVISRLVHIFPNPFPFLGWEVPYQALLRPIPRALWPGKPEGLSLSMETALGVEGLTLAASFVGEAYISWGWLGTFLAGVFFGAASGWWSRMASPRNSDFGILVYASGFFAAVISMRSLFVFTTALLPTLGAIFFGRLVFQQYESWRERKYNNMKPGATL